MSRVIFAIIISAIILITSSCADDNTTNPQKSPMAEIINPDDGAEFMFGDTISFEGIAFDPEDGKLVGNSLEWRSDKDGLIGRGTAFLKDDLSPNLHTITLISTDGDGKRGTYEIDIKVIGHFPPSVLIHSPNDGSSFALGDTVIFWGTVDDPEDGTLPADSIVWSSDIDGLLGFSESVEIYDLSINTHNIALRATDSDGFSTSAGVKINITDYCWIPPDTPKKVFENIACGLESEHDISYGQSIAEDYSFVPNDEDRQSFPQEVFENWTKEKENQFISALKSYYQGQRTIWFGDENGNFPKEDIQIGWAAFEGPYQLTLEQSNGSEPEVYRGTARFFLQEETSGWVLIKWEDLEAIEDYNTSGWLRGTHAP